MATSAPKAGRPKGSFTRPDTVPSPENRRTAEPVSPSRVTEALAVTAS